MKNTAKTIAEVLKESYEPTLRANMTIPFSVMMHSPPEVWPIRGELIRFLEDTALDMLQRKVIPEGDIAMVMNLHTKCNDTNNPDFVISLYLKVLWNGEVVDVHFRRQSDKFSSPCPFEVVT